jgi:hypothetical protein
MGETTGAKGLYPIRRHISAPGVLKDDDDSDYDTWIQIPIDWKDYERARRQIDAINKNPGDYDLQARNCTSFVCLICAVGGVNPNANKNWLGPGKGPNPGTLEKWFENNYPGKLRPGPKPEMPGPPPVKDDKFKTPSPEEGD